ncbi:site-specific integrase [Schinkia azotoformans]|uniref:tyrosine-type recombinase/integrase n=1 Tax=Schinkia azotoformans TaxID=1454 RepID=UPI002E217631|nr:site-specific integrase [Schinkia azotoformans]
MLIDEWLKECQKQVKVGEKTESTFNRYERMIRLHILPKLGDMIIQDMKPNNIQTFFNYLRYEKEFKRKTCKIALTVINDCFKMALKRKLIKENPALDIDLPKAVSPTYTVWEKQDIETFLSLSNLENRGRYYSAILLALFTGLRKGEILGLTWDNVDFENKEIIIKQIVNELGQIKKRTKTKKARIISVPPFVLLELQKEKIRQESESFLIEDYNPNDLVFCTKNGNVVLPSSFNKAFNTIIKRFDLKIITVHALRHSHCSLLVNKNYNIKLIQERLGHANVQTTLNIYSHLKNEVHHELANDLNVMFENVSV